MNQRKNDLQPEPMTGIGDYGGNSCTVFTWRGIYSPGKPPVTGQRLRYAPNREGPQSNNPGLEDDDKRRRRAYDSRILFRAEARDGPLRQRPLSTGNPSFRNLYMVIKSPRIHPVPGITDLESQRFCMERGHYRGETRTFPPEKIGRLPRDGIVAIPYDSIGSTLCGGTEKMLCDLSTGMPRDLAGSMPVVRSGKMPFDGTGRMFRDGTGNAWSKGDDWISGIEVFWMKGAGAKRMPRDVIRKISFCGTERLPYSGTERRIYAGTLIVLLWQIGSILRNLRGRMQVHGTGSKPDGLAGRISLYGVGKKPRDGTKWILTRGTWNISCSGSSTMLSSYIFHLFYLKERLYDAGHMQQKTQFRWRIARRENRVFGLLTEEVPPDEKRLTIIRQSVKELLVRLKMDKTGFMFAISN